MCYVTLREDLTTFTRKLHNTHTTISKGHTFCVTRCVWVSCEVILTKTYKNGIPDVNYTR